jgi:hypothetical protein
MQESVLHAATKEGFALSVLDVSNPRFAVPEDPGPLSCLHQAFLESERQRRLIPRFVMRWMLKSASRRSRLFAALFGSDASYLDSITTYVMKLGPDNLAPPYDSPVDRKLAAWPHLTFLRLRTQQMASLAAEGLASGLNDAGARPLHLINIAGGPAIDSLNTLILLSRSHRALLARPIAIQVLDLDDAGAFFGKNALQVLQAEGPLDGLDIDFVHRADDWNDTFLLRHLLAELAAQDAVIAASSEGGLFEYGSDEAIVANLEALDAGGSGAQFVVGSVTRDDETRRRMIAASRFKLIPRGLERFSKLAAEGGFDVAQSRSSVWSDQVLLVPNRR